MSFLFCSLVFVSAHGQSSEFAFQGRLTDAGVPVATNYDLRFTLFDAASGGTSLGTVERINVSVSNGVFTVKLDFGSAAFDGSVRYIETEARPTGVGSYASLSPRIQVVSVPYALRSMNSTTSETAGNATQLGGIAASQYVTTTSGAESFVRNTTVQQTGDFNLSGSGILGGSITLPTTDGLPNMRFGDNTLGLSGGSSELRFWVGGTRALRLSQSGLRFDGNGPREINVSPPSSGTGDAGNGADLLVSAGTSFVTATGSNRDGGTLKLQSGGSTGSRGSKIEFYTASQLSPSGSSTLFRSPMIKMGLTEFGNLLLFGGGDEENSPTEIRIDRRVGNLQADGRSLSIRAGDALSGVSSGSGGSLNFFMGRSNGSQSTSTSEITFSSNDTFSPIRLMTLKANGNVGIGNATPSERFEVGVNNTSLIVGGAGCPSGSVAIGLNGPFNNCTNYTVRGNGTDLLLNRPTGGDVVFRENNGNTQFRIRSGGVVQIPTLGTAGSTALCQNGSGDVSTCSSSIRYKDNLSRFSSGLDLIRSLRPVLFNWKDGGILDLGLVAEDVATLEPLLTTTNSNGDVEGVKYDRVGVVLVNAVNEQQELIEKLQRSVREQQRIIDELKMIVCSLRPTVETCVKK